MKFKATYTWGDYGRSKHFDAPTFSNAQVQVQLSQERYGGVWFLMDYGGKKGRLFIPASKIDSIVIVEVT